MDNSFLNIDKLKRLVIAKKIYWTKHCLNRLNQREISINDVKEAIIKGKIIENYKDDYPYPSCLICGKNIENKTLHIVCGINDDFIYVITAYYPNVIMWEDNMETRRGK